MMAADPLGAALFVGIGILLLAGLGLVAYEVVALLTGRRTISNIAATHFYRHPRWWVVGIFVAAYGLGAITTHFTCGSP